MQKNELVTVADCSLYLSFLNIQIHDLHHITILSVTVTYEATAIKVCLPPLIAVAF